MSDLDSSRTEERECPLCKGRLLVRFTQWTLHDRPQVTTGLEPATPPRPKQRLRISVCTYNDHRFEVIIQDPDTYEEVEMVGRRRLSEEEHRVLDRLAPACLWTLYEAVSAVPSQKER